MVFGMKKLEWLGYWTVKKKFEHMFIRFDRMYERDRRTDERKARMTEHRMTT